MTVAPPLLIRFLTTALVLAGLSLVAAEAMAAPFIAPVPGLIVPLPSAAPHPLLLASLPSPAIPAGPGIASPRLYASLPRDPSVACSSAITAAERSHAVPPGLMQAIARVESGRPDAAGRLHPWPWTIDVEGKGYFYATKAAAIEAVRGFQAGGHASIDIGCMQVNLVHHPHAFPSLEAAFDPGINADYAARFLLRLHTASGSWRQATADYHSQTPALGAPYARQVFSQWNKPAGGGVFASNVWSHNVWSGSVWSGTPGGGNALSNGAAHARMIAAPPGTVGRGLAAYRAAPIPIAGR